LRYISRVDFLYNPLHQKRRRAEGDPKKTFLDSLPWIMKQTLFLENEMLSKLRSVRDVGYLIFVTDDTKIRGNRAYDQGDYYEALEVYEQVTACFAWLEFKDRSLKDRLFTDESLDTSRFSVEGIIDEDVNFIERPVTNEADRQIETETSECPTCNVYRDVDSREHTAQRDASLHEHAPL